MAGSGITQRADALQFLFSRLNFERSAAPPYHSPAFRLERMAALLERLGNPHLGIPTVHVAGTKGKGSTCAMVRSILTAAGYRVGLYTSPHLTHLEERFQIDGAACSESQFVALTRAVQAAAERVDREPTRHGAKQLTFFEITTAMAFLHFSQSGAERVVLETGLGGRLDSTNVCRPAVCLITSISLDHTRQLGGTLDKIAREKAGIIKPGTPVVSGATQPLAQRAIAAAAEAAQAPYELLGRDFAVVSGAVDDLDPFAGLHLDYRDANGELLDVRLSLCGAHQARNAALAIRAMRWMDNRQWAVSDDAVRRGLQAARCPARLESIGKAPRVILDVAHNEASVVAMLDTVEPLLRRARPRVLVFTASRDKDARTMLAHLLPRFDHVLLTRFSDNPRAMTTEELASAAAAARGQGAPHLELVGVAQEAWRRALELAGRAGVICITGSFFLAGELRDRVIEDLGASADGTPP